MLLCLLFDPVYNLLNIEPFQPTKILCDSLKYKNRRKTKNPFNARRMFIKGLFCLRYVKKLGHESKLQIFSKRFYVKYRKAILIVMFSTWRSMAEEKYVAAAIVCTCVCVCMFCASVWCTETPDRDSNCDLGTNCTFSCRIFETKCRQKFNVIHSMIFL